MNLKNESKPTSPKTEKKKNKKRKSKLPYNFVKVTGGIPALIWMRPKVIYEGKKPKFKNAMICANHNSLTDPVLVLCVFWNRTISSLATTDLYSTPLASFFFEKMRCIPVDKQNFSMDSFHAVCERLDSGEPVLIFPEGGLNNDSEHELKALKSGVVLMAHKTSSPIIPMYIVPHSKWYRRRVAVVGEPIDVRAICGDRPTMKAMEDVTQLLHLKEQELKKLYYSKYEKENTK